MTKTPARFRKVARTFLIIISILLLGASIAAFVLANRFEKFVYNTMHSKLDSAISEIQASKEAGQEGEKLFFWLDLLNRNNMANGIKNYAVFILLGNCILLMVMYITNAFQTKTKI